MSRPVPATHIRPSSGFPVPDFAEIYRYRDLLWVMVMRDIRLRYKQTALGAAWVVVQPLVAALIFYFVFGRLAHLPSDGVPYLLFAFVGVTAWQTFSSALTRGVPSLVANANVITKVYFPRLLIPVSGVLGVVVDLVVSLAVTLVMMLILRYPPPVQALLAPLFLVQTLVAALAVTMLMSALSVSNRDFINALPFLVQIWMYASPVAYSASIVPKAQHWIYGLNPMAGVVEGLRWSLLGHTGGTPSLFVSSAVTTLVLLVAGMIVFRKAERRFADVI